MVYQFGLEFEEGRASDLSILPIPIIGCLVLSLLINHKRFQQLLGGLTLEAKVVDLPSDSSHGMAS